MDKPANWEKVYAIGYKSCSYDASGKLPPRNQEFVERLQGKIDLQRHAALVGRLWRSTR